MKLQPFADTRLEQDENMAHFFRERDQIDKNIQDILKQKTSMQNVRKNPQWQALFDHPKILHDQDPSKKVLHKGSVLAKQQFRFDKGDSAMGKKRQTIVWLPEKRNNLNVELFNNI